MKTFGALLLGAIAAAAAPQGEDPPMLSVCEVLNHRLQYNGKNIIAFGRLSSGTEGSWLTEECGGKLLINGSEWGYDISLTYIEGKTAPPPSLPAEFQWRRESLIARLPKGTDPRVLQDEPNCRRRTGWAAVFGRFETRAAFQVWTYASGQTRNIGFGHLGGSPAQLISPQRGRFCLVTEEDEFGPAGIDASLYLWIRIRAALKEVNGADYFENSMRDALVPGSGLGVRVLKGSVVSGAPTGHPEILVLGMSDRETPEVTLRLNTPLNNPIAAGTLVEFEGIAREFTPNPFMVTFEVPVSKLKVASEKK